MSKTEISVAVEATQKGNKADVMSDDDIAITIKLTSIILNKHKTIIPTHAHMSFFLYMRKCIYIHVQTWQHRRPDAYAMHYSFFFI